MEEIHSKGKTIGDVAEVLKHAPIHPRIVPAIRTAHALGYILKFSNKSTMSNIR